MGHYDYSEGESRSRALETRQDPKAERIRWMLSLPDLSRRAGSPIRHLLERVLQAPCLAGADHVTFPEIVPVDSNFDLLNAPADHPSRRPSDTYYVDTGHVLRTQTTSMWAWYLRDPAVRERLRAQGEVTAVSYGKVYRNDEIDRWHYPVFHQIDALCVAARERRSFDLRRLDEILLEVARVIYGNDVETRIEDDSFPFTEPSRQLEVRWNDEWLEVVGAGLVHPAVLARLELDPQTINGFAFGFGLDRLAMAKMRVPDIRILWSNDARVTNQFTSIESRYAPVSKYPPTRRDISFVVAAQTALNDFYEIVRARGADLIEQVEHIDCYANEARFGAGRVSHTFRITYRSFLRTLTHAEINEVQAAIRAAVGRELGAELR